MAKNSSSLYDDLSDIIPQPGSSSLATPAPAPAPAPKISPYLVMQAQQEAAAGKPGAATAQLGSMALKTGAIHPAQAAYHAAKAGVPAQAPAPAQLSPAAQGPTQAQVGGGPAAAYAAMKAQMPQTPGTPGMRAPVVGASTEQDNKQDSSLTDTVAHDVTNTHDNKQSEESQNKGQQTTMQKFMVDPKDYAKAIQTYQSQPLYDIQRNGIDKLQAMIDARRKMEIARENPDLSGLMMAADFANNTDRFSRDYKRPDPSGVAQQLYKDQAELQGKQAEMGKEQQAGVKDILSGGGYVNNLTAQVLTQRLEEEAKQADALKNSTALKQQQGTATKNKSSVTDPGLHGNPMGEYDKWSTAVTHDPILNKAIQSSSQLAGAQRLIQQNQNVAALMAKGELLHAAFGRVNQTEYTQAGGDPGTANTLDRLWGKYNDFINKNPGQDASKAFTPEDQREFKQAINTLVAQDEGTIATRMGMYRQDALSRGLPVEQTENVLTGLHPAKPAAPAATQHHASAPKAYNGSAPLPANASDQMKQARFKYLQQKAGH